MSLREDKKCQKCGNLTASYVNNEKTYLGVRELYRCSQCGWQFFAD